MPATTEIPDLTPGFRAAPLAVRWCSLWGSPPPFWTRGQRAVARSATDPSARRPHSCEANARHRWPRQRSACARRPTLQAFSRCVLFVVVFGFECVGVFGLCVEGAPTDLGVAIVPSRSKSSELSPAERSLRARIAVETSWANTSDPTARTAPGRQAFLSRFEREVDPDGTLPELERKRRAEHARRAYFHRLALASAKARRLKKAS